MEVESRCGTGGKQYRIFGVEGERCYGGGLDERNIACSLDVEDFGAELGTFICDWHRLCEGAGIS